MAKVSNIIFCEDIQEQITATGKKIQVVAPLQFFTPAYIPGMYSFSVLIGLMDYDPKVDHTLKLNFKLNEADKFIMETEEIPIPAEDNAENTNKPSGMMCNMDMRNVILEKSGEYVFNVYFDGELIETKMINAVVVNENATIPV